MLTSTLAVSPELLLLLHCFLHDLLLHSHVLDGVSPDVALGHAPEAVSVLGRAYDFPQVDVHPSVAVHQVAVVRLPVLQLDQLKRDRSKKRAGEKVSDLSRHRGGSEGGGEGVGGLGRRALSRRSEARDATGRATRPSRAPLSSLRLSRGARAEGEGGWWVAWPLARIESLDLPWGDPARPSANSGATSRARRRRAVSQQKFCPRALFLLFPPLSSVCFSSVKSGTHRKRALRVRRRR